MDKIYTVEQVAEILQMHHFTILGYIKQGKLKAAQLGRVYRIRQSDLDDFFSECLFAPSPAKAKQVKKATTKGKRGRPRKTVRLPLEH